MKVHSGIHSFSNITKPSVANTVNVGRFVKSVLTFSNRGEGKTFFDLKREFHNGLKKKI